MRDEEEGEGEGERGKEGKTERETRSKRGLV